MTSLYVAVEVAQQQSVYALPQGQTRSFSNTPCGFRQAQQWIAGHRQGQPVHLVLEATGPYGLALAKFFYPLPAWQVSVVNPLQARRFARAQLRRNKTDPVDAVVLAQLAAALQPEPWHPLKPEQEALRSLVRRLAAVQEHITATNNGLHALKAAVGHTPETRASLQRELEFLLRERQRLQQVLKALLAAHPSLQQQVTWLQSIPGIGWSTAVGLLGEVGDFRRYRSPKALAAHAGLVPRQHLSASSVKGKSTIGGLGSRPLRRLLYMPALAALRHNPAVRTLYQRLLHAGKAKMLALLAAMHKLLRICFGVLKNQQPFQDQKPTTP
jgi:transposase